MIFPIVDAVDALVASHMSFTMNLLEDLDPACVDKRCHEEKINAPAVNSIYKMLRAEPNAKIQLGEIVFDTLFCGGGHRDENCIDIAESGWLD